MNPSIHRARLLREHRRYEEAAAMLLQHLASDPQDPDAHVELALNRIQIPGQRVMAVDDIRRAISLDPESGYLHALHARILCKLDRDRESLTAAEHAIALDPENEFCWLAKGEALAGLSRWKEAEAALAQSLALDPDHEYASNMLSIVLRKQNRLEESDRETMSRLSRDAEDPVSLANAGWSALQRGDTAGAEKFFTEALRIDPESEYAREGLKESFRARSAFYRVFLRWAFFMQRFSEQHQMWIMIGIFVAFRFIRKAAEEVNPAFLPPLFVAFYLFVFGTWLSGGIANLMILRDRAARLALDRTEIIEGIVVGGGFLLGMTLGIIGLLAGHDVATLSGAVLMLGAIPCSMVFTNASRKGRIVFGTSSALVYVTGALGVFHFAANAGATLHTNGASALVGPLLLTFLSTWAALIPSLRKGTPES